MDLITSKKQVTAAESDSEVDAFRKLLNKSKKGNEALFLQKKSRTINKMGMWEELEMVYRDMEQREKDYQVAVEIGKMLLDKNKELSDINAQLRVQLEDFQQANETELIKLTDENEKLQNQKDELKKELKHLKLQMNMMSAGPSDTEMKAMLMSDEFAKMEDKLEKYKKEIAQIKTKNKSLTDELERTKAELDTTKQELEEEKKKVKTKIQIRTEPEQQPHQELSQEEIAEREKLEEELTALALSKAKLEQIMNDLSFENSKLRESITEKEDQRNGLERMIDSLSKANQMLQRQQEEERQLLEDKVSTISNLQQQIEEQALRREELIVPSLQAELWQTGVTLPDPAFSRPTLQTVPSFGSTSTSSLGSIQPTKSHEEEEDLEHEKKKKEWQDRMTQLQTTDNELKQKEEKMATQEIDKDDKEWLLGELKKFRKTKADEHAFLAIVYELRERLYDAEIKNLSRTMRNVGHFQDLVLYSHAIIDTVIKDINRKVVSKEPENPMVRIIADLILENCKLRKIANDYAEAINQGTIEKLEKFKKYWPTTNKTTMKKEDSKKSIWQHLPLFDFFTGWSSPPPNHPPQSNRNKDSS